MEKIFKKIKTFFDMYKIWIFLAALFGTNGMQAYVNKDVVVKPIEEPSLEEVKVVMPPKEVKIILRTINCNGTSTNEHIKEHHGGN